MKGLERFIFSSTRVRLLPCFSTLSTGLNFFHSTHAFSNSFICRSHLFIHVQNTTPTATVTIQLPIISLSIVASTSPLDNTYIITRSSYHLSAYLTHFPKGERVKMAAYTRRAMSSRHLGIPGIGYHHRHFRRSSHFRCYSSRKVPSIRLDGY